MNIKRYIQRVGITTLLLGVLAPTVPVNQVNAEDLIYPEEPETHVDYTGGGVYTVSYNDVQRNRNTIQSLHDFHAFPTDANTIANWSGIDSTTKELSEGTNLIVEDPNIIGTFNQDIEIKFDSAGGTDFRPRTFKLNHMLGRGDLPTPRRNGYEFVGWRSKDSPLYMVGEGTRVNNNTTLVAQWVLDNINSLKDSLQSDEAIVKFDLRRDNQNQAVHNAQFVGHGTPVITKKIKRNQTFRDIGITTPGRPGHSFVAWEDTYGNRYQYTDRVPDGVSELVLYPVWSAVSGEYKVDLVVDNGTINSLKIEPRYYKGPKPVAEISVPPLSGYTFVGWFDVPQGQVGRNLVREGAVISQPTTLYAHWRKNDAAYVELYDHMNQRIGELWVAPGTYTARELYPYERDGFQLLGWRKENEIRGNPSITIEANTKVKLIADVRHVHDGITVYFDTNGGSEVSPLLVKVGISYPVTINDYFSEKPGYKLEGWYKDQGLTTKVSRVSSSDASGADQITLYAKWTPKREYLVRFVLPNGYELPPRYVEEGQPLGEYPRIPPEYERYNGLEFIGWSMERDVFVRYNYTLPINKNTNFYAYYSHNEDPRVNVTFNPAGGQLTTGQNEDGIRVKGITVQNLPKVEREPLVERDRDGNIIRETFYNFRGWYNGNRLVTTQTTVYGNLHLTARWEPIVRNRQNTVVVPAQQYNRYAIPTSPEPYNPSLVTGRVSPNPYEREPRYFEDLVSHNVLRSGDEISDTVEVNPNYIGSFNARGEVIAPVESINSDNPEDWARDTQRKTLSGDDGHYGVDTPPTGQPVINEHDVQITGTFSYEDETSEGSLDAANPTPQIVEADIRGSMV